MLILLENKERESFVENLLEHLKTFAESFGKLPVVSRDQLSLSIVTNCNELHLTILL